MNPAIQAAILAQFETSGLISPREIDPILPDIRLAVPLIIKERAGEFRDVLVCHGIKVVIEYVENRRFSASSHARKIYLGADGLERSWAYCYVFVSGYALWLDGKVDLFDQMDVNVLPQRMSQALKWIIESDVIGHNPVYPADLPRPNANRAIVSKFENYLFNSYLAAIAWITLHEIAHIVLHHTLGAEANLEKVRTEELEADAWAADWLMDRAHSDAERSFFANGITVGVALAAYLEMWVDFEDPSDHPNYPDRLNAILERIEPRFEQRRMSDGYWFMGAILMYQRASLADKAHIFGDIEPFSKPREFIQRAREAYPDV